VAAIIAAAMPIYEYRCANGHQFEVFQTMSEDPASACQECGAPVERVFRPIAVHFKGSGFYTTDYARKADAKASSDGAGGESAGGAGKERDAPEKKRSAEKKPAAASSGKDD
jgi:putative FmdB family regulatory protein